MYYPDPPDLEKPSSVGLSEAHFLIEKVSENSQKRSIDRARNEIKTPDGLKNLYKTSPTYLEAFVTHPICS